MHRVSMLDALLFESSAEELKATDKTQIAITIANLAASAALKEKGFAVQGCAGFSLGEYAALCEAGVIRLEDVFPIVKLRGILMEKAARALDVDSEESGMAVVLGLPSAKVASTVETLAGDGVYVANLNSPAQTVVSGSAAGLAKAEKALKEAGAKRVIRLPVSGPFHSPFMSEARKGLDEALAGYVFTDPRIPVYSNVTGRAITSGAEARELCGKQVVSPVRWVTVEESLFSDGFDRFFEVGPGTVLTGLMKALKPDVGLFPCGERPGDCEGRGRTVMLLKGKNAVVTGGSRGIGNAIALEFLREGATVYAVSRKQPENLAELQEAAREGARCFWKQADVTKEEEISKVVEEIAAEAGSIEILVNNAGITRDGLIFRMPTASWEDGAEGEPHVGVFHLPRHGPDHDQAEVRLDHQHLLRERDHGERRTDQLLRLQGGAHRLFEEPRPGSRLTGRAGECDRPGLHRDRHDTVPR